MNREDKTVVRIWKAPKGAEAKYVTVTAEGKLVHAYASLADIRKFYAPQIKFGIVELRRELEKTYKRS